jgi:hypothetical protein
VKLRRRTSPPSSSLRSEPPDAEIVVAAFRTMMIVAALFVPRLLNGPVPISQPLIWLAVVAGTYNLLVVGAYFWRGHLGMRRPFIIGMDLALITMWIRLSSGWDLFPLYYVVVVVAAMWYRIWGGVLCAFCCNFLYLVMLMRSIVDYANIRALGSAPAPPSLYETFYLLAHLPFLGTGFALNVALLFLVGSLVGSLALAQERERTRRLEEQLLLANYQREIDLATQLQPLLISPELFGRAAQDFEAAPPSDEFQEDNLPLSEAARLQSSTRLAGSRPLELLPTSRATLADKAHVKLGAVMQPAREFGGGDYFDFIPLENGRSALCIADVSGKSVRAQARLPLLKYALRALAPLYAEPEALVTRLNETLAPDLQNELFIGLCYIVLDPRANRLKWCNAGHIAPLLLPQHPTDERSHATSEIIALETLGPPLGPFPEIAYESRSASWRPGDRLLLFTDGLTDALSYRGREDGEEQIRHIASEVEPSFWLEPQSVAQLFLALAKEALEDHDTLFSRLSPLRRHNEPMAGQNERGGERRDDITVVVARRALPEEK